MGKFLRIMWTIISVAFLFNYYFMQNGSVELEVKDLSTYAHYVRGLVLHGYVVLEAKVHLSYGPLLLALFGAGLVSVVTLGAITGRIKR